MKPATTPPPRITELEVLAELACDGAWTAKQLEARVAYWGAGLPKACLFRQSALVKPTAWARHPVEIGLVRLSPNGAAVARTLGAHIQTVRPAELEHALGLAELRWRCGIPAWRYTPQDAVGRAHRRAVAQGGIGNALALWDGTYEVDGGVVLCEYDHGRYTARQVREKLTVFRQAAHAGGIRIVGTVWGVPTEKRASWLHELGTLNVVVMDPATWLV